MGVRTETSQGERMSILEMEMGPQMLDPDTGKMVPASQIPVEDRIRIQGQAINQALAEIGQQS